MHLPFQILFPTGGSSLDAEAQTVLGEAVRTLRDRTDIVRIRVEGHTDTRGPDMANDQLSLQRAQAVIDYLVSLGVPSAMLEAQGYGATQPRTSDTREMDRAQNRRVEFSILVRRPMGATGTTP
jgi:outer membrane protein OmpA-like peptidoglycan-associated protein